MFSPRRLLPKSLLWRAILIVVTPMVVLQVVVASLIVQRHFDGVTRQMSSAVGGELRLLIETVNRAETETEVRSELFRASRILGFNIELVPDLTAPSPTDPPFFDVIANAAYEGLRAQLRTLVFVAHDRERRRFDILSQSKWGLVRATPPRGRIIASNPHLLLTWMAAAAIALIAVSLLYLRNQIRPVVDLAAAAEAFGKGRSEPIRISGAREVRMAAAAFLDARTRIERHMEQRTRMLSAVSHDLRTPLTRMKLALDMMPPSEERDDLRRDIGEMAHIVQEFLDYAQDARAEEFTETEVMALAQDLVTDARRGGGVVSLAERIETPGETTVSLRPRAMRRGLQNLLDNALSFGSKAQVMLTVRRGHVEFSVEDDGPGIPEDQREAAFRPFHRLDEARNRDDRSGVGLGLALALDTVRGHGGDLVLDESPSLGGLRATARLPR